MIPNELLQQISQNISALIPDNLKAFKEDLDKNIHAVLQNAFVKMDLVPRHEFDIQAQVLKRTREKLEALEEQVKKLEAQLMED